VRVVVAPDGFGGTLGADEAAAAIAAGWRRARPDDDLVTVPMSDGGEGLLRAVASPTTCGSTSRSPAPTATRSRPRGS
jgi:glycerate 2-kinase